MLDFKFRAFDKKRECYVPIESIDFDKFGDGKTTIYDGSQSLEVGSRVILERYIGLEDGKGEEIFQGDIFKDSTGLSVVVWNGYYAGWCLRRKGWAFDHFFGEAVDPDQGYVVGNINVNRKLIEGENA